MMIIWLILALVIWVSPVSATDYYISPSGNDTTGTGLSTSSPWLTFAKAFGFSGMSNNGCGHTLNLMNGIYGDGTSTGKILITTAKVCTAGAPMTIKALNERQADIRATVSGTFAVRIDNSAYVILDGLVMTGSGTTVNARPLTFQGGNHYTIRNSIAWNSPDIVSEHPIWYQGVLDSTIEDTEIYRFRHHGIFMGGGSGNVVRRTYINRRGMGGGGSCIALYPNYNAIVENVICDGTPDSTGSFGALIEMNSQCGTGQANDSTCVYNNKVLGSIGYSLVGSGVIFTARLVSGVVNEPTNNTLENVAIVNYRGGTAGGFGTSNKSTNGTVIRNMTVHGAASQTTSTNVGLFAGADSIGDGNYSTFFTNDLAVNMLGGGFQVSGVNTWTATHVNAYATSGTNYFPSSSANYSPLTTPTSTNPALGTCMIWIPDGSPMKGAGAGGADIGANVLYEYSNGVLTSTPLWDTAAGATNGKWLKRRTIVAGINDVAGSSLFDVNERLNVNRNGCNFPTTYVGGGGSDTTPPAAPTGVTITKR